MNREATIQEQLRETARFVRGEWQAFPDNRNPILAENLDLAADRIEALEAALRKVRDMNPGRCAEDDANNWLESRSVAREALESSS